jgi:hypothetical protein
MQWGSLPFHLQSLRNLSQAMLRTRKLCAVMVDTLGREVFVRRDFTLGENGWPKHGKVVEVATGGEITLTVDAAATQTEKLFPVNYEGLPCAFPPLDAQRTPDRAFPVPVRPSVSCKVSIHFPRHHAIRFHGCISRRNTDHGSMH